MKLLHFAALSGLATPILGQSQAIPVRTVSTPVSSDSGTFHAITTVRPLSDGRVLVHDVSRRRILLLDATLKSFKTVADTAQGAPNKYGSRSGAVIPYLGDSSVFVDAEAQALIVVAPEGTFGR